MKAEQHHKMDERRFLIRWLNVNIKTVSWTSGLV